MSLTYLFTIHSEACRVLRDYVQVHGSTILILFTTLLLSHHHHHVIIIKFYIVLNDIFKSTVYKCNRSAKCYLENGAKNYFRIITKIEILQSFV